MIRSWVANHMMEALETSIHAFLYRNGCYPSESFRQHSRFDSLYYMCDIQEVHDYVSHVTESLRNPLVSDAIKSVNLCLFHKEQLESNFEFEFPLDFCREVTKTYATTITSEADLASIMHPFIKDILLSIYKHPQFNSKDYTSWRIVVETKDTSEELPVEEILLVSKEAQDLFNEFHQISIKYPLTSHSLSPYQMSCISTNLANR